jgi:hypothetical protein
LSNLPERVRIVWPHHALCGTDIVVHGWLHINGEIHLRVTLADGSFGCLPITWTTLLAPVDARPEPHPLLNAENLRDLHALVQDLARRRKTRARVRAAAERS